MSGRAIASGGSAHRRATAIIAGVLLLVALTLLGIGANSPYTHANLNPGYDDRYTRTDQIVVGAPVAFDGLSAPIASGDPVQRGESLFVTEGCVGCHALGAQGGAVAKPIAGVDAQLLAQRVRDGKSGMPKFSTTGLTDQQLADIATYLKSLPPVK